MGTGDLQHLHALRQAGLHQLFDGPVQGITQPDIDARTVEPAGKALQLQRLAPRQFHVFQEELARGFPAAVKIEYAHGSTTAPK